MKKNIKLIISFIIGAIILSGISVYANYIYFAKDVSYTRNGVEISVADALNELYDKKRNYNSGEIKNFNGQCTISVGFIPIKTVVYLYKDDNSWATILMEGTNGNRINTGKDRGNAYAEYNNDNIMVFDNNTFSFTFSYDDTKWYGSTISWFSCGTE